MQINLKEMQPTNSLLCVSMECENTASVIRNRTVKSMKENDIAAVAYRYLQTRQGENCTFYLAASCGILAAYIPFESFLSPLWRVYYTSLCVLSLIPNVRNNLNYREVKLASREWLILKIDEKTFEKIDNLNFTNGGLSELMSLLMEKKLEVKSLLGKNLKFMGCVVAMIFGVMYRTKKSIMRTILH